MCTWTSPSPSKALKRRPHPYFSLLFPLHPSYLHGPVSGYHQTLGKTQFCNFQLPHCKRSCWYTGCFCLAHVAGIWRINSPVSLMNSESCFRLPPRALQWKWTSMPHSSNQLSTIPFTHLLLLPASRPHSHPGASWDHLPNSQFAFKSVFQCLLWGQLSLTSACTHGAPLFCFPSAPEA